MEKERVRVLNDAQPKRSGRYVLYWMQQAQRARMNHALEYAIDVASSLRQGAIVGFGLTDGYPDANLRHYHFMLEGLAETARALRDRGIQLVVKKGAPDEVALALAKDASLVVCDQGYLRHQRAWRARVAERAPCQVVQVEGEVVVPVEAVSSRAEHAARTIRPKILRLRDHFLVPPEEQTPEVSSLDHRIEGAVDVEDWRGTLEQLYLDRSVPPVERFRGGTSQALLRLEHFLEAKLQGYATERNEPIKEQGSGLSPYLHFGQISPIEVALRVRAAKSGSQEDRASFLEDLIVRRELSHNFVFFNEHYDKYACLPDWAKQSLGEHARDRRAHIYDRTALERGQTHDRYWNAAMREMRVTGFMHNYMRMYWGKKVIEWLPTPEVAYSTLLAINNKYFLDGRDANSYANVAWCFGLHDRPWQEREIFGKVRYMNDRGLERKFDIEAYARWAEQLEA